MDIVPTALGHCGGFFESAALTSTEVVRQRCVTAGGANGRDMCSRFLYFSQLVRIAPAAIKFFLSHNFFASAVSGHAASASMKKNALGFVNYGTGDHTFWATTTRRNQSLMLR